MFSGLWRAAPAVAGAGAFRAHLHAHGHRRLSSAAPFPHQDGGGDDGVSLAVSQRGPPECTCKAPRALPAPHVTLRQPQWLPCAHVADSFLRQPGLVLGGGAEWGR